MPQVNSCIVALKFPAFVPDIGWFKAFEGTTVSSGSDSTKVKVTKILKENSSWELANFEFTVAENCVVSRYMVKE